MTSILFRKGLCALLLCLFAGKARIAYAQGCEAKYISMTPGTPFSVNCNVAEDVLSIQLPSSGMDVNTITVQYMDANQELQEIPAGTDLVRKEAVGRTAPRIQINNLSKYRTTATNGSEHTYHIALGNGAEERHIFIKPKAAGGDNKNKDAKPQQARNHDDFVTNGYGTFGSPAPGNKNLKYNKRLNQVTDGNTIHVFVNEYGDFIRSSLPTTATEKNFFVIHVIYLADDPDKVNRIRCTYSGDYNPRFTVYGTENEDDDGAGSNATDKTTPQYAEKVFGPFGPFTEQVDIAVTIDDKKILDKRVNIAPLHYIALNAGLFGTFLRNPDNIRTGTLPNGDTTLLADDPTTRGFVTVMLTFYPFPRNLLFPLSRNWKERLGFTVGTSISKKLAENFFGGISYDVARGLAIVGGVHYGRRQVVVDNEFFEFGKDKFTGGTLQNRIVNDWNAHFFIGLNLDTRLLNYIFNPGAMSAK